MSDFAFASVTNHAAYVANFYVTWENDGTKYKLDAGNYPAGDTNTIRIPADATNIYIKISFEVFIDSWRKLHEQAWPSAAGWKNNHDGAPAVSFTVTGTTGDAHWREDDL
jgi:hypothetical protein